MKKKFSIQAILMITVLFLAAGCQKSVTDLNEETSKTVPDVSLQNQCQLTYAVDWNSNPNWFSYNNKGLVSEWRIDFGSGIHDIFTLEYDNNNRLASSEYHFDGALLATIQFEWTDDLITTEHWDFGGFLFDAVVSYDEKKQITGIETSYGYRSEITYSPNGNPITNHQYFDDELIASDILTYTQPNRNPLLAIPGLPYGFPYGNYVFGKFHETGDTFTDYSSGAPIVILDTNPAQTTIQFGFQNHPSSITFYDNASISIKVRDFEYQNCGPAANAPTRMAGSSAASNLFVDKKSNVNRGMFLGKSAELIEKMKKRKK